MRFLTPNEVLALHRRLIELSGEADGIRNIGGPESAIAQPRMTFGREEWLFDRFRASAQMRLPNPRFVR